MSDADKELKRELECLRLASDFIQLSRGTLGPDLRARYVRMADYWSDQAVGARKKTPTSLGNLG